MTTGEQTLDFRARRRRERQRQESEQPLARTLYVRYPQSGKSVQIMPIRSGMRNDRIELRASREQKRLLTAAAAYEKLDLTTFVMRTTLPAAEEIVARNERIALTERDTARILELLEHPPTPPAALRAAAKRRRKRM
jgi:uncharacterized protein (DUF1778 family)